MTLEQKRTLALTTLRRERECVANEECDRNCGECPIAGDRDEILAGFDAAIELLEKGARKPRESVRKLPCPVCGTTRPELFSGVHTYVVRCRNRDCLHAGIPASTEAMATRFWNRESKVRNEA